MIKKIVCLAILCAIGTSSGAVELPKSAFDKEHDALKYELFSSSFGDEVNDKVVAEENWDETKGVDVNRNNGYKSPGKAFVMSMVIPGSGQYYYGSKIKAAGFFGLELVTIAMAFKSHSKGEDLTAEFEEFNLAHWSRDDYAYYVETTYDNITDGVPVLSHHLPETDTQQYFEMTGKYDQFSWGWDDAIFDGRSLYQFGVLGPPKLEYDPITVPVSQRRLHYEQMRADANDKFESSRRMIYVTMFNHVVSAFEAYFSTKKHNRNQSMSAGDFSWRVRAGMKSSYAFYDTPTVKVSYSF